MIAVPVADTLNVLLPPTHTVASDGDELIAGNVFTVSLAGLDVPGVGQVAFDNWQRYRLLFIANVTAGMVYVADVAPGILL